jgi:hypothetical protein
MFNNNSKIAWDCHAGTPRHHGLCKLMLAAHMLVWGEPNPAKPNATTDDIRLRVAECMTDFQLACMSLKGTLPDEIEIELFELYKEVDKWVPTQFDCPRTSALFKRGHGTKGRATARFLAERILAIYVNIQRFDAVATHCNAR